VQPEYVLETAYRYMCAADKSDALGIIWVVPGVYFWMYYKKQHSALASIWLGQERDEVLCYAMAGAWSTFACNVGNRKLLKEFTMSIRRECLL